MNEKMVHITSDGTRQGTKVQNWDGQDIPGIRAVEWHIDVVDGRAVARIEVRASVQVRADMLNTTLEVSP